MAKASPTQRTLAYLRDLEYEVCVTEKWNPHANVRQDMFGFVDLVYLCCPACRIVAVQTTSGTNHSSRRKKVLASAAARQWIECGGRIEVWSWSKRKMKRGGVAFHYVPRIDEITLEDFAATAAERE